MRPISSQAKKGAEPTRTLADDLALLSHILRVAYSYFFAGRGIRKEFLRRQRLRLKLYVDEVRLP